MRGGDDRPRPRFKKRNSTGATICGNCGYTFPASAAEGLDYAVTKKGEVSHKTDVECRVYLLSMALGSELDSATPIENWLFVRYPRERLLIEADRRPKDWAATGWMPRDYLHIRVRSLILHCSWAWPVCMQFAVQIASICPRVGRIDKTEDDILVDQTYHKPLPLRQQQVAAYLNEWQPNVSRAIKRLRDAKEIAVDEDGLIWPAAKLLDLSIEERLALYAKDVRQQDEERGVPKGVPKTCRGWMRRIQELDDENIRSVIFAGVKARCTRFRGELNSSRADLVEGIKVECRAALHLIPDLFSISSRSSRSNLDPEAIPSPAVSRPAGEADRESLNEQWAAGEGRGAMNKLQPVEVRRAGRKPPATTTADPPPEETTAVVVVADKLQLTPDRARKLLAECHAKSAACVMGDVLAVAEEARATFGANVRNPTALLLQQIPLRIAAYVTSREAEAARSAAEQDLASRREQEAAGYLAREAALTARVEDRIRAMGKEEWLEFCKPIRKVLAQKYGKEWSLWTERQKTENAEAYARSELRSQCETEITTGAGG